MKVKVSITQPLTLSHVILQSQLLLIRTIISDHGTLHPFVSRCSILAQQHKVSARVRARMGCEGESKVEVEGKGTGEGEDEANISCVQDDSFINLMML